MTPDMTSEDVEAKRGIIHWAPNLKAVYLGDFLWIEFLFGCPIVTFRKRRIWG